MRIRDGNNSDPGWKKYESGIRDKHPGSATLKDSVSNTISISTVPPKTDLPHDESGIPVVELPGRDPERSIDPPHVLVGL
jgi:hypothetical protein